MLNGARRPVIVADVMIKRYRLQRDVQWLIEASGIPFGAPAPRRARAPREGAARGHGQRAHTVPAPLRFLRSRSRASQQR